MSEWALVEHLTNYLARPRAGQPRHPTLWPSEASAVVTNSYDEKQVVGKCRRATFFRYAISNYEFDSKYQYLQNIVETVKKEQVPVDKYMYWIWRAGDLYEEYLTNLAKSSGVFIDEQVGIFVKDINLSGKIDLRVINPSTHKISAVEVKSVYGHNSNTVMGTPASRRKGVLGTPRDGNLMQIALYDWFWAKQNPDHENSRLVYGARDTGRYAEYEIKTELKDKTVSIFYRGIAPSTTAWTLSPITINSIVEDGYQYVTKHIEAGKIPDRDYEISYSDEKIQLMYDRGELGKTDSQQIEKIKEREEENTIRVQKGLAPKKPLKKVEKGDWQCSLCVFRNTCYNSNGEPKAL